jgi:CheY-like chemotaxis protein
LKKLEGPAKSGAFVAKRHPTNAVKPVLLYVEDDDDNWIVAKMRLSERYDVVRASTAKQACELLVRRGKEFAAILMDIELQGSDLNGVQLTELIRGGSRKNVPAYAADIPILETTTIIFVTAHGAEFSDDRLEKSGADRVISKPVDFRALNLAITQTHLDRVLAKKPARPA